MDQRKVILIIMDGWGIAEDPRVSAIDQARTTFYDQIREKYPHSRLRASEGWVGLPDGQMGNSEVGHTNIGAGRIIYQELVRITNSFKNGDFARNESWKSLIHYCRTQNKPLHLLGLVSDGGVHSHINHLKGILSLLAQEKDFPPVWLHIFTDGRDCDPQSGIHFVQDVEEHLKTCGTGKIASIIGRYYSMDRNQKYERIAKSCNLMLKGEGTPFTSAHDAIRASYEAGVTDEFILPHVRVDEHGHAIGSIHEGDAVLFFNFRTDRGRQLTRALTQQEFPEEGLKPLHLHYTTMTRYDESFTNVNVIFEAENVSHGLGETLSALGKKQIRIAETEKYPHVTYFFNGGREDPFEGETRILCPSPSVATYDLQPEMSAREISGKICAQLEKREVDFVCLNFANPDMVGHTGVFAAAVKACETVDLFTRAVSETALRCGYQVLITADHGNADKMINADGSPNTAHTTALVPFILLTDDPGKYSLRDGKLGDIAPTILHLMGLEIPALMTGEVLVTERARQS